MDNTTNIALSRLDVEQRAMDVVANNIANASTPGYRAQASLFSDYLVRQDPGALPRGEEALSYTQDRATYRDLSQGALKSTGNPLDLALGGDGYFQIQTASGTRLTRAGRFEREQDGKIVDSAGNALLDESGSPLTLDPKDRQITISGDGTVATENGVVGKIGIVVPEDPNKLSAEGAHLLRADTRTHPATSPSVAQGMLEDSNVHVMSEMTHMIQIQRDYENVAQFVTSQDQIQREAIDKITQAQT